MIVYRELKSIEQDLGIPVKTLYAVSNSLNKHYRITEIPKKDGGTRRLSVPSKPLKLIQKRINDVLLCHMPVSVYAKAYKTGCSVKSNALPHIKRQKILKLDILHFFDSILYSEVKNRAFPSEIYSEQIRILLSMLCYFRDSLPQGAPSSPAISNIIMYDFDNTVGAWCEARGIRYTRYCDDMTFSGDFDTKDVKEFVSDELKKYGFFLNNKKTAVAHASQKQQITGIVVNDKIAVPSEYKRKIRQEIYYCKKFGISEHLKHTDNDTDKKTYTEKLLGKVNYILSVEPYNSEFTDYKMWLKEQE